MPTAPDIEGIKKLVALEYPEVTSFRCVEVKIPDDDKYLYALAGFISLLGNAWSYTGDKTDRIYRASRWRMAYRLTTWAACMNCEELRECLQPLFDALRDQVNQDAIFRQYGTENPVGVPLPPEVTTAPLAPGSNPTCDSDVLWSQCEQLVDYSNTMITDTLEQLETATNNIELAQVITSLPILDELGADAIAGYVELLFDGIAENYAAEYDLSYRNTLACEIFCLCQDDCEITIDRVYSILLARVTAHFGSPGETINTIGNLLSYLVDQDIDGDVIVDTLFFLLWGGAKLINSFIQEVGSKALETILNLAVNDANDDWVLLCDVCAQPGQPIIAVDWVPMPSGMEISGEDVTEVSAGVWEVTSTELTSGAYGITIQEITGAVFELYDFSYPDGANASVHFWRDPGGTNQFDESTIGETVPCTRYGWIWTSLTPGQRVRFSITRNP